MKSTKIEKSFKFQSAIFYEKTFLINSYTAFLTISIETEDPREQQIAVDRIGYWLTYILQNSVLIQEDEQEQIMKYSYAGMGVCTLPDEPYDQLVAMILMLKFNAITENKIIVTNLILKSMLSEGVRYTMDLEDAESSYGEADGWWNEKDMSMSDYVRVEPRDDKIVKLFDTDDWAEAGLHWKEKIKII